MRGLPLPDLFLKVRKRTKCFKLKKNTYLAFKITFNKERLLLLLVQLTEF
jgi:ribosomal protein L5